jgi:hypothetical protein
MKDVLILRTYSYVNLLIRQWGSVCIHTSITSILIDIEYFYNLNLTCNFGFSYHLILEYPPKPMRTAKSCARVVIIPENSPAHFLTPFPIGRSHPTIMC